MRGGLCPRSDAISWKETCRFAVRYLVVVVDEFWLRRPHNEMDSAHPINSLAPRSEKCRVRGGGQNERPEVGPTLIISV